MLSTGEGFVNRAPLEMLVQNNVAAMCGMNQRAAGFNCSFRVDHMGQRFILHIHALGGVLRQCTCIGHHGSHPLTGVAHHAVRQYITRDSGCIDANLQAVGRAAKFIAGQYSVHAGHGQRHARVDVYNTCAGVGRGYQRHMLHAGQGHIRHKTPAPGDKARVFLGAAFFANVTKLAHGSPAAIRCAANVTASTICW